jgi:protein-L-isoaspartate(D-aspartate) O-methyltransferase
VERLPRLEETARALLAELGYRNVTVEPAGPTLGASHHGPFDAIIVTAASPQIPDSLVSQLTIGGRMVLPVGPRENQELLLVLHTEEGASVRWLGACRFVPLIGLDAFTED